MVKRSQAQRVLEMLSILSHQQRMCVKSLVTMFGEGERTIQRDIKLLREFLEDALIQVERGCYQLLSGSYFSTLIKDRQEADALKRFFEFLTLMDAKSLQFLEGGAFAFLKKMKRESAEIYALYDNPIEELKRSAFLPQIKAAIKERRYCDIVYNEKRPRDLNDIQPLRILYAKNNWYLAAMTQNYKSNGGFKRFRINFIEKFTLKPTTFHRNVEALRHIETMQTLFSNFKQPDYEVVLEIDKEIERYFKVKKYLKSQKIEEQTPRGLIVSYRINDDMEIIPLVRQWIPYIRILSPERLAERFRRELAQYIRKI